MTGCNTGRNIQKYKGAGASTLQDALENGNTASLDVVLQSPAVFIGDGGGLSNINASSTTGNLQAVTNNGATSTTKITLTNSATSLETTGNIVVSTNVYATEFYGDGGTLSNIAANKNFQDVTTLGNTSSLTISFTNPAESITTTGNVIVGTNVHATEFVGDGSSLTSLNADNINSGDLAIARGGTGVTTGLTVLDPSKLNTAVSISKGGTGQTSASAAATALGLGTGNSPQFTGISLGSTAITESSGTVSIGGSTIRTGDVALGTQTSGNYVKTVTAGNGLDMTNAAGEGSDHTLSLDLKANHGLVIDNTELKIDLKASGGLEFNSGQMRVKLNDTDINGTLPVSKGGTGLNSSSSLTRGDVLFVNSSGTFSTLAAESGKYLKSRGNGTDPTWASVTEEAPATAGSLTAGDGLSSDQGTFNGSTGTVFSIDLLTNGGIVFDSSSVNAKKLLVNLGGTSITGQVDTSHGGTGATAVTGTAGNNVLSVSPTLTGTTLVTNITASGTIIGTIAAGSTISGTTITASSKLVGDVNEASTSKNVFGSTITAGSKLVGDVNEASTTKNVFGSTITAGTGTGGFSGKGTSITGLNATNLSSGVIHKNRYTTSVPDDNSIFFYDTAINELNTVPPNTSGTKYLKSVGTSGDLSWDTVTATISIGNNNDTTSRNLLYTTDDTDLKRDTDGGIKYTPSSNTLSIGDTFGNYKTLNTSGWSGNAATATKADSIENAPDTTAADKPVAFLIGDNVKTTTNLTINPSTAELKATKFSAGTGGFVDANFTDKGVIYSNSGKLVSTALGTVGQVIKAGTNGVPEWGNEGAIYWTQPSGTTIIHYNTGNVGINTSTPQYRLDVNGDIRTTSEGGFRGNGRNITGINITSERDDTIINFGQQSSLKKSPNGDPL